jgi:hypothetical protein
MGGSSGSAQTVTNRTEIDPVTQQWRSAIMNAGQGLYNQGTLPYYPGQTVVPFSDQTQSGMNYLQQHAMQGAPNLQAANDASGRALSGWNPAMPFAANAAAGGLSNNPAMQGLSQYGTGNNQYAQSLFNQAAGDVGNAVNAQFAQAGRFGNNAARTDTMTRGIGNLYNQMMTPLYEAERNRGLTAQQTMGSLYDSGANRALGGAELLGGLYSQGNQDAARAQALLPGLFSYGQMPGQAMLDIGGMYEGQAQNYLQDDMARYNAPYNQNWQHLQNFAGLMSGLPDFSGSTSTQRGPGENRLMQGLGAASSIASIFAAFSDRRLKREIVPLGSDINGTPLYSFAYIWDAPGERRIGVMADEAPPHAVHQHPSGFAMVDYGAL